MVECTNLRYAAGGKDLVSGISLRFEPGKLHLVVGPNGAGKSTLVKLLARLLVPAEGHIAYDGEDVSDAGEGALARHRAVLSQAIEVAFPLTVREVVTMGRYPHFGTRPTPVDEHIIDEVMQYFDVGAMSERSYPTLSGGEKQRVNFARVLAQVWRPQRDHTRVLFLDEPLTFLDIGHQLDFMRKVRSIAGEPDMVVIGVVHDLNLAARFADSLVLLNGGRVVATGTHTDVLTSSHVKDAFGVEPVVAHVPGSTDVHLVFE